MPSFEVLLPVGAIGFYLYDAAILLYANEVALERGRSGWRGSLGLRLQLGGRRPFLPNPLTPGAMLFRVVWDRERSDARDRELDVERLRSALAPARGIVTLQAALLLFVLPPVSTVLGAGNPLLAVFAAFYLLTVAALGLVYVRRADLGLSARHVAWLAVEALLCAPFAVNLVRKVSVSRSLDLDWPAIVGTQFRAGPRAELLREFDARIDEWLAIEEAGSPGSDRLEDLRARLRERLDVPVVE